MSDDDAKLTFWRRGRFDPPSEGAEDGAYLQRDNWNDYGYKTLWTLFVVRHGAVHEIGAVKIGERTAGDSDELPNRFSALKSNYFSLGQDVEYYERLNKFGPSTRRRVLEGLNDVAVNLQLFAEVAKLEVTRKSLLRWVRPNLVETQYHRVALGGVVLSPYSFTYTTSSHDKSGHPTIPRQLDFDVNPIEMPRTNIHALIGPNGVGKSFILNDMASALSQGDSVGEIHFNESGDSVAAAEFAGVVSVAFSAFDAFEPSRQSRAAGAIPAHYVGLKKQKSSESRSASTKDPSALAREFGRSLARCAQMSRVERWRRVLALLRSDVLFAEVLIRLGAADASSETLREDARDVFAELSSGHKIVLLTLTKLVEVVEEASLVLIDEPESHLHPPLLAAFVSALSELLEERNGVAIIATHSPVVLQEIPRSCVWKLAGAMGAITSQRPVQETYGENVGVLTQEVFGLEVVASGFHRAVFDAVEAYPAADYAQLVERFGGRLGSEARALLQTKLYVEGR